MLDINKSLSDGDERPVMMPMGGRISLLLATTLALLSTAIVSPTMPDIAVAFAAEIGNEWLPKKFVALILLFTQTADANFVIKVFVLSVPSLFILLGAPLAGSAGDFFGRRRVLIVSLLGFGIAGSSGYFVDSLTALLVGRMFLGFCMAGIISCTVAMVGDYFVGVERDKFIGLQAASMKIGGVLFLLMGGFLADLNWRAPFLVYLISFIALPGVIYYLHDVASHEKAECMAGDLPVKTISIVLFSTFVASAFYFMILVQLPFVLNDAFDVSRLKIALATAMPNIIGGVVATQFFRLKTTMNFFGIFCCIFLLTGIGYALVANADSYMMTIVSLAVAGLGIGLIVPAQGAWMLSAVSASRRGIAIGLVATAMYSGHFVAPLIVEPFAGHSDPFHVFYVTSRILLTLALIYFVASYWTSRKDRAAAARR